MDNLREGWLLAITAGGTWAYDNPDIILFIGIGLVLCGIALAIRHIWRRWLKIGTTKVYYKVLRNPVRWFLRPINRLHRQWSEQSLGIKMAKWRKGHLSNAFYETIHREIEEGRMSKQQGKRLQAELAKFFGLRELARIKTHPHALKEKLLKNEEFKIGPKQKNPTWGGKPGEDIVPQYNGLGEGYLSKKKGTA